MTDNTDLAAAIAEAARDLRALIARVRDAEARIEAVRALHPERPDDCGCIAPDCEDSGYCAACHTRWPCSTVRALGPQQPATAPVSPADAPQAPGDATGAGRPSQGDGGRP